MDVQKTMEFILEQLADLAVRTTALNVSSERHEKAIAALVEDSEAFKETVAEAVSDLSSQVQNLASLMQTSHGILSDSQRSLFDSQKATDDRLNALIGVVDRLIPRIGESN